MARVPPPRGVAGVENLPRTKRSLLNCFNNGSDIIISRPGIAAISEQALGNNARGGFEWNGSLYEVYGTELRKITDVSTGASTLIGTIAGSANIETDIGFNEAVIVVRGGAIYTLDNLDTLTNISGNSNIMPCDDVTHIDGRFVYIPTTGDPAFFSDVGAAGTVQVESFFDPEQLPDKNRASFNFKNTLYIAGTDSIELFRNTGASPVPFSRVGGGAIDNGYIGGLLEYNNTWLFIGREKGQDLGIYAIGAGTAPKISNETIDLILTQSNEEELRNAISGRIKWRGYDIATFRISTRSFGYYAGEWFFLDTVADGAPAPWAGGFITQYKGDYYSAFENKFGKFERINTDYGERITKSMLIVYDEENANFFSAQSFQLGISQGFNSEVDGTVALRVSKDNVIFGPYMYKTLGNIGQYGHKLEWNYPGGLGNFDGFMGLEIYTTENIDFSADHLILNIR